jgi:hypothetical protein
MRLKYLGTHRRLVDAYEWNGKNAVADVTEAELAALLLTQPDESFEIAGDEPLLQLVTGDEAGALVVAGIAGVEPLAAATAKDVANALDITTAQARALIGKAKQLVVGESGVGYAGETEMTAAEE